MKNRIRKGAAALAALLLLLSAGCKKAEQSDAGNQQSGLRIGYASEGVSELVTDQDQLERAVEEMFDESNQQSIGLAYKNEAVSVDGINFSCTLGNSDYNVDDMYIQIFGDQAGQDELYLSGLIRPGTAFENITLNHALNPGINPVYCVFTYVHTDEDGTQSISNSMTVEMDFIVAQD